MTITRRGLPRRVAAFVACARGCAGSACRDQLQDFLWVTGIQTVVWLASGISGLFFLLDETLLFVALVTIKHRLHVSAPKVSPAAE